MMSIALLTPSLRLARTAFPEREDKAVPALDQWALGLLARLPKGLPVGLEIPTETLSFTASPEERAAGARLAAEKVLKAAGWL